MLARDLASWLARLLCGGGHGRKASLATPLGGPEGSGSPLGDDTDAAWARPHAHRSFAAPSQLPEDQ